MARDWDVAFHSGMSAQGEASRALGSKIHPAGIVLESKRTRGVRAVLRAEAYSDKHQRRG